MDNKFPRGGGGKMANFFSFSYLCYYDNCVHEVIFEKNCFAYKKDMRQTDYKEFLLITIPTAPLDNCLPTVYIIVY